MAENFSFPGPEWLKTRRHDPAGSNPFEEEEKLQVGGDHRSFEEKDRDKILHSPYLRRLGGVSQIMPSGREQRLHNRLTHSLEVSQMAKRLAEIEEKYSDPAKEYGIDPHVAEACGLAHDLGHPPFGHVGEHALDELVQTYKNPAREEPMPPYHVVGGFEGNAQTTRIVGTLGISNSPSGGRGMNLTRRTLLSCVKYPWPRINPGAKGKFSFYGQAWDKELQSWLTFGSTAFRTPECEAMDYADDIIYSIYDASDFYREGLIDLSSLGDDDEFARFVEKARATPNAPLSKLKCTDTELASIQTILFAPEACPPKYDGSLSVDRELGMWIVRLMDRLTLHDTKPKEERPFQIVEYWKDDETGIWRCSLIERQAQLLLGVLKSLAWVYVINDRFELQVLRRRADTVLRRLVSYFDWAIDQHRKGFRHHWRLLAPYVHLIDAIGNMPEDTRRCEDIRLATDIVASFTDLDAEYYFNVLNLGTFPESGLVK